MGHLFAFVKGYVLLLLATFPNFGESTKLTVGEKFQFTCKHDGENNLLTYPFSNTESFFYHTKDKISSITIKAQTFDNGNSMKCAIRSNDGEKLLRTTDVFEVRPNATVKEEFDLAVIQEHVFYEKEEFEFSCNSTLVGWIKVDANDVVTDGDTINGLITKKFNLTSDQFDGAKLICLKFKCQGEGCDRVIQRVVKFRRASTNLTVGEEFEFTCTNDGTNKMFTYLFSNAESFRYYTKYNFTSIKMKVQTFDNGNSMKCTNGSEVGEKLLRTTNAIVVRPNATVKEEFDSAVIHEHFFYENEEFQFSCNYSLVGWIKVDANDVVTDGRTSNDLITKKFNLTSDQFDGAKLICLQFECVGGTCNREIQKVVKLRRASTNLTVGEEFEFTCTNDGTNKMFTYLFSNAESFRYYTKYNYTSIKIKVQTFDNGNSMKCTNGSEVGEKLLRTTNAIVVRPNATVKEEFDSAVIHEHFFYENEEFEFSCNYSLVGWIKVDANDVVTDGRTSNGLITKKFNLTSDQFDGAKLICLQFECLDTILCNRVIQKVVKLRRESTKLTVGEKFKITCTHDGKNKLMMYPFANTESFNYRALYNISSITIKAQTFDNGNSMKCAIRSNDGEKLLRTTDVFEVRPNATVKEEFDPAVIQEHVFYEKEEFEFSCNSSIVGWIKVDANDVVTDGDTINGLITKKFNLTSDQFDGAKLICLQFECVGPICNREIQKVVKLRRFVTTTARTTLRTTTTPRTTIKSTTSSTTPRTTLQTTSTTTIRTTSTSFRTTNPSAATSTKLAPSITLSTTAKPQPITTPSDKQLQNLWSRLLESVLDKGNTSFGSKKDSVLNMDVHADGDFVMFKFQGPVGPPGPAGAPGAPGAPGVPGLPGVCPVTCPVMHYYHDSEIFPEGIEPGLGSEQRPASAACRFIPATQQEGPAPDPYWVMEGEKFPVKCDKATNRTCLILNHDDNKWINETKILMKFQTRTWLSRSGFDLDRFNTITQSQLRWLQDQSTTVQQRIRVYVANSTFPRTNLRMLSAQDVVVGGAPSLASPMFYSVQQLENTTITVDGKPWSFVDLVLMDSAKRLPVVDFHVEDASGTQGPAYISVQLRELCFG